MDAAAITWISLPELGTTHSARDFLALRGIHVDVQTFGSGTLQAHRNEAIPTARQGGEMLRAGGLRLEGGAI